MSPALVMVMKNLPVQCGSEAFFSFLLDNKAALC